jgi:hypothetical protein
MALRAAIIKVEMILLSSEKQEENMTCFHFEKQQTQ